MTHPRASAAHGSSVRYWGVLLLLVASLAFAQGKPSYTTPGVWKAWDWDFENGGPVGSAATRAEVKALAGKVMEMLGGHFNEFLVPERPDLKGRDFPISAGLVFGAFPQEYGDDGRVEWGETALMWFELNRMPLWQTLKARDWRDVTTEVVLPRRPVCSRRWRPRGPWPASWLPRHRAAVPSSVPTGTTSTGRSRGRRSS